MRFFLISFVGLLFASCVGGEQQNAKKSGADSVAKKTNSDYMFDCADLKKQALRMDSIILKQTDVNKKVANDAIKAFTEFASHCSSDSIAPIYLIKTAQIAQAVNNSPQAKVVLETCINDYPNFKDRAAAIFLLAQLYDEVEYLNNEEQAKILYQKIIDEYPKSDWVISAKGALKFIGKTDEQIIEEIQNQNKK